jgi:putative ABC transport system permease protein
MTPEQWLYTITLRIQSLLWRERLDRELDEELQDHLEQKTHEYLEKGWNAEEAHYAALRDFGNLELSRQNCRDTRKTLWAQNLVEDVRFGLRILHKDVVFTAIAVLTLALGIGANTAIFSVINTVLLRPLPYAQPERLVSLKESSPDLPAMSISLANLADWQIMNTAFENIGGYRKTGATLTDHGEPRHVVIEQVTAGLFPTLGVQPVIGHLITAGEDIPESEPVVLLSNALWMRDFGRDPRVLGRRLRLDGVDYTIIGVVATDGFPSYWHQIDAFTSLGQLVNVIGGPSRRDVHLGVSAYARLKPGITLELARAEMLKIAQRLEQQYPQTNIGQSVIVESLLQNEVGNVTQPLKLLMAAVILVFLIACLNVANLLSSRTTVRRREIAIRTALGGRHTRLAAQFLCENTLLALIGGALGLVAAYCTTLLLKHRLASILPRADEGFFDLSVLAFALSLALVTGIILGVLSLAAVYRSCPLDALRGECDQGGGVWRSRSRNVLAISELAVTLILLITAGLALRSLFRMLQTDSGLRTKDVLTGVINFPDTPYKHQEQLEAVVRQLVQRVSSLPGVTAAGFETAQLLGGSEGSFQVEGEPQEKRETYAELSTVTPGGLEAMGVELISGRFFGWSDRANAKPVCLVDDVMAAHYWPGDNAIGKRLVTDTPTTSDGRSLTRTVVGVVHRIRMDATKDKPLVEIFIPYSQYQILRRGRLVISSQEDRASVLAATLRVMHSLDPNLTLYDVRYLADLVDENVAVRRLEAALLNVLAIVALMLATLGVYGATAYMVNRRTREIAVRLALGAKRRDIVRLVFRQGLPMIIAGTLLGILLSVVLKGLFASQLMRIGATDPWAIGCGTGLLVLSALMATCIPALAAMRVNPIVSLRKE